MRIAIFFLLFSLCSLLLPLHTFAQEFLNSENITVEKDKTVNQDLFAVGKNVVISGNVNGDAYLVGENILVEGKIDGDLIALGKNITLLGDITQDARIFGWKLKMYGSTGKNLSFVGETVTISSPAKIDGSITSVSKEIFINSPIGKGATIAGGEIILNSLINGNVLAAAKDKFLLDNNAKINGDLDYYTGLDLKMSQANNASISGEITHNIYVSDHEMHVDPSPFFAGMYLFLKILGLLSIFITGTALILIAPNYAKNVSKQMDLHFLKSLIAGFIILVAIPMVIIFLFISLVGIPLAILLILLYLVFWFFGSVFAILFIGEKIMFYLDRKKSSQFIKFLVGFLLFTTLSFVPIFGQIISIVTTILGVGAFILEKKRLLSLARENNYI